MIEHFVIESAEFGDISRFCDIEGMSFSQPWSRENFESSFNNSAAKYFKAVRKFSNSGEMNEEIVGFIGLSVVLDEAEVINLAVEPAHRNVGIGRSLVLEALKWLVGQNVCSVFLEVRFSNIPAIELYKTVGFDEIGVRKRYYSAPVEDAMIMKLELF